MGTSNTRYTAEFKAEAIKQVVERGHPVREVAERLGDSFGVTDLAIGNFPAGGDLVRSSGRVIVRYWSQFHCYDPGAGGWAYLFDIGLVDRQTAFRWRGRVWSNADRDE